MLLAVNADRIHKTVREIPHAHLDMRKQPISVDLISRLGRRHHNTEESQT